MHLSLEIIPEDSAQEMELYSRVASMTGRDKDAILRLALLNGLRSVQGGTQPSPASFMPVGVFPGAHAPVNESGNAEVSPVNKGQRAAKHETRPQIDSVSSIPTVGGQQSSSSENMEATGSVSSRARNLVHRFSGKGR